MSARTNLALDIVEEGVGGVFVTAIQVGSVAAIVAWTKNRYRRKSLPRP